MNPLPTPLSEAERQVLIAIIELCEPVETPNNTHYTFYPKTLEEAASYFRSLRQDWAPAYASLSARGLLQPDQLLSPAGMALARQERRDHPPIWYWYREFYTITSRSQAYSRFCAALYGRDLCQTDFSDMAQVNSLIQTAGIKPGDRVLDLGCGKGLLAEYISDSTGARAWGVDYTPEAIQQALERTAAKRGQLDFQIGNFDHLDFPPGSFDVLVSIDTLYMPNDLPATLRALRNFLTPGGKLMAFYSAMLFDPALPRETLLPDGTDLARALQQVGLPYRAWDFSEPTFHLMRAKHRLAQTMRAEFEAEGTLFLYNHLMAEADGGTEPYDPRTANMTRYLYQVTV
jgi:SAM-dependent methyltransferase